MQMGMTGTIDAPAGMAGSGDAGLSLERVRGMIDAMTKEERATQDILDQPRRRRIAAGAGVAPLDVERFLRQFRQVQGIIEQLSQISNWCEGRD